jgi:hypothetical protein
VKKAQKVVGMGIMGLFIPSLIQNIVKMHQNQGRKIDQEDEK